MPERVPSKWWRRTKVCLRGVRFAILLLALLILTAVLYLNEIGLPGFVKKPIVDGLRDRGFNLQFARIRWRWYRGLVAEDVHFGASEPEANVPQLSLKDVELRLNHAALWHLHFKIDSLTLRGGALTWTIAETNQPVESLTVTNIQCQLSLLPGDQWDLDHFSAAFAGANLHLAGSLTNASAMRDWKFIHGHGETQPAQLRRQLRELAKTVDAIRFQQPPELNIIVHGDAREFQSFNAIVTLDAPAAETPWGVLTNGTLLARLVPPAETNGLSKAEFIVRADEVATPWGNTRHFQLDLHASGDDNLTNVVQAHLEVTAAQFATPWAQGTNANFKADWTHSLTNPIPLDGSARLRLTHPYTRWGNADELRLDASLTTPLTNAPSQANAGWAWWATLEPYNLDWNCHLVNLRAEDFVSQEIICGGSWRSPELTITNLHTEMYQGQVTANASLNVASRVARFACVSDFDVQKAVPFLSAGGRDWFQRQQFEWQKPPLLHGSGSVTLPEWTNRQPDWRGEVLPTLFIQGDFKVGQAGYQHLPMSSAQSHLLYSNMVWTLPDLVATRPEGKIELTMIADDRKRNYYFQVHSSADVKILRESLPAEGQRAMDAMVFSEPPQIDAEIWGRWRDYDHIGARARLVVTNFSFRGQTVNGFHGDLAYTNKFILITDGRLDRSNLYVTASSLGIDIVGKRAFLTNGYSTAEPMPFLRMIGPKVARDMEPYHFLNPPIVRANGTIPLTDDTSVADLHFQIDGGPYEWLKFRGAHITGLADWIGDGLALRDMKAAFYDGTLTGSAAFDFRRDEGTDFQFETTVTGVNLQALMADISKGTNHIEGTLNGYLKVTQANTEDNKSWFGNGQVDLHNGLIWEIPIFGVLSPMLDVVSPGMGESRLGQATASFVMTNSVLRSEDLELRSPTVRLLYRGTIDFDLQVDATVEAQVGKDAPLLGPLVSTMLSPFSKLFETKVTGTLMNPKRAPVTFAAKLISPFIHPLRTFKELLLPGGSSGSTNTPPANPSATPPPQ